MTENQRESPDPVRVSVAGDGARAEALARALRGVDGVSIVPPSSTECWPLATSPATGIEAVAFVARPAGSLDLAAAIKSALMSRRHVLVAMPVALESRQLLRLHAFACGVGHVLLFDTGDLADESLSFVQKMTGGPQPLWRPRYIRAQRTGDHGQATLDELAISDVAAVLRIAGGMPSSVSAFAPRVDDETAAPGAMTATLAFAGGTIARVDVCLIEPERRREIAVVCEGRTVVIDSLSRERPLRIQAAAGYRGPQRAGQWAETVTEQPLGEPADRLASAAALFIDAVRSGDEQAMNGPALAEASAVWEAARASAAAGGELTAVDASQTGPPAERPVFQLIPGGGQLDDRRSGSLRIVRDESELSPRTA